VSSWGLVYGRNIVLETWCKPGIVYALTSIGQPVNERTYARFSTTRLIVNDDGPERQILGVLGEISYVLFLFYRCVMT